MTSRSSWIGLSIILVAAGWLLAEPVAADWLVTTDGSAIETRGSWEVRGRLVVFHAADGSLTSIRLADVDLAASRDRTEAAARASAAPARERPAKPVAPPKARFVLTDADVGHVEDPPLRRSGDSDELASSDEAKTVAVEEGSGRSVPPEDNPLEVVSWEAVLGAGASGVAVRGVVRNPSEFFASAISVEIRLFDLEGEELGSKTASIEGGALAPGEQGTFKVPFPGVFSVGSALFEISSFNAVVSKTPDEQ